MKKTLEQRINRLERLLKNESCTSQKCESFESDLDDVGARASANSIAAQFGRMLGVSVRPDDYGEDVIQSPIFGWLPVTAVEEIESDPDARFAFHYVLGDGDFSIDVYPSDNSVNLINEDGYSVDPKGKLIDPVGDVSYAFPLRLWKGFDLSMVEDDDEDDYYDEFDDEDSSDDGIATECNRRCELEAKLRRLERAAFKERFNRSRMRSRK